MASIFHNYAIACCGQSLDCKSKSKHQKLHTLANKSAVASYTILKNATFSSERTLILWMLNLQQLLQLTTADGNKIMARKYYCEMAFLRTQFEDYQEEFTILSQNRNGCRIKSCWLVEQLWKPFLFILL